MKKTKILLSSPELGKYPESRQRTGRQRKRTSIIDYNSRTWKVSGVKTEDRKPESTVNKEDSKGKYFASKYSRSGFVSHLRLYFAMKESTCYLEPFWEKDKRVAPLQITTLLFCTN